MMQLIKDYDRDKGEKHNYETIEKAFGCLPGFVKHWSGVFILDSLIANVDRHQDNWGLIVHGGSTNELTFSPTWRKDYAFYHRFRKKLYINFFFWKLFFQPVKTIKMGLAFLTKRFNTKIEMTLYRVLKIYKISITSKCK